MDFRGGAVKFLGTKRHHDKWLKATENYDIKGCFAMSELGHGSNVCEGCLTCGLLCFYLITFSNSFKTNFFSQVRGIETVTTYDSNTGEFIINTPCESGQKYWIGGAANVRICL